MHRRNFLATSAALSLVASGHRSVIAADTNTAANWPHWRGPLRNDLVTEPSGFRNGTWPLKPLWKQQVGEGSTSPLVVGDRFYTLGYAGKGDTVYCLSATTGKTIWSQKYPGPRYGREAEGDQGLYAGPTSTPEYDPKTDTLYTLSCDGQLIAWQATQGTQLWSENLYEEYAQPKRPKVGRSGRRDYGYTTAPLVHGEQLLLEVGGPAGTIVSLEKRTGKELWRSTDTDFAGHTGGLVPMVVEGVDCVAVLAFSKLLVVRVDGPQAGETVAEYPWLTEFGNNIASPGVLENSLIITSGYNIAQTARLDISLNGAKEVWKSDRFSKICSPVIAHNRVYFCWSRMVCLDFATGDLVWEGGQTSDAGSLILTDDDRLLALVGRGKLLLCDSAQRSPEKYAQVASVDRLFSSDAWPHVVIAGGRIYCKGRAGEIVCLEIDG